MPQLAFNLGDAFWLNPQGTTVAATYDTPAKLLSLIVKNIYVIAAIILFFFIVAGGLTMILNAGNVDQQKQGSKTIGSAIAGFLILFASYWIIRLIEVLTGVQIFNPGI